MVDEQTKNNNMKLIIPMAGRGTRVRPHSHVTPKPLLPVRGRSMVERIVDTFNRVLPRNLEEGVFVLGPDFGDSVREQLRKICASYEMDAHFPIQERAEGTAHAVYSAEKYLDDEGIIVFADTLFGMEPGVDLEDADVVAWVKHVDNPSRFGVAVREGERIVKLVEKPSEPVSNEALIGIYYVKDLRRLGEEIHRLLDEDVRGKGGEFQLTDAFDAMLQDGAVFRTASVTAWMDCGTIPALLETTGLILEKERSDTHEGTVENSVVNDPVYVGPGASVRNAVIGPNTSVEEGAEIENAVVRGSIMFSNSRVENAVLHDSLVGRDAAVTGFAGSINVGDHSVIGRMTNDE